ncbi:YdeI/OmpD-associated family protein [Paraglaciecola hydrolytica]|uniref:Bacteriocin-protection protein n=1 Tax=Paraglaciecola hydrolytica TaxID=1799789 RepID=A0A148KMV9_9ALTE|nr:YdeI/OmpD-associated family protein [Paraglaciecola hydrolytica]KXI27589.1 hypothetical protein AX660_01140 [Paraglaciecola hydrolytica]
MPEVDQNRVLPFENSAAFWQWLQANHDKEPELWLKIYKKHTLQKSISWDEAVIEALCWGWIDGVKKSLDEHAYLQRFTPRKANSNWSQRNREHVEKLIAAGKMQESGLAHCRAAQADGRWQAAYAPSSEMVVPEDFLAALSSRPNAKAFFDTLNRQNLYAIVYRLQTAKKPETRQKRFDKLLNMLENEEKLY